MSMSRGTLDGDPLPGGLVLPAGGQRRRLPLAGLPKPVARARAHTVRALGDWCASVPAPGAEITEDIVLVVAELVGNAMLHGDGPLELVLDLTPDRLRIEISDRSTDLPAPREPHHPALPGGHGLFIVQRIADRWGAEPHAQGKTIWAEFEAYRLLGA
ncbi:ATP-binding protein [Kitasatospora sp. A2-31]|uniref:ATP-binding protein n=1 Tax=Kitasatospora sp. A2-31 TaxID=2916414 RepID=UPI001EEAA87A|nr:ATP-binding protein [Kitasatospora sp. A2-31]MCG6498252.1 ATP-binding protein [Kitasatospora sp. A2-31]